MNIRAWLRGAKQRLSSGSSRRIVPSQDPAPDVRKLELVGPHRTRIQRPTPTHGGIPIRECGCWQCREQVKQQERDV